MDILERHWKRKCWFWGGGIILLWGVYFFFWRNLLPDPLFKVPYSTVVKDRDGNILGMTVADDEQFRVAGEVSLSSKYETALLCFEDKRFKKHWGVDPWALLRAMWLNLKSGTIMSGGSTLTMQVIRLARSNPPRTVSEKLLEMLMAIRLEQVYTKEEILNFYVKHAPFGGNVVGLEAAAIKYFNHRPEELSWAEAALLAVLPNAPALIFPGKNSMLLKQKRNALLRRLRAREMLSEDDFKLALEEPLPDRVFQEECIVPHLLSKAYLECRGEVKVTTVDVRLQGQVNEIVQRHVAKLSHNHIYNAAVLVGHIPTGEVRAYVGNGPKLKADRGSQVDIITAPRSSGSILKPLLYAFMLQSGHILPNTLIADIPSRFGSYVPMNFSKRFQGVVPADKALSSSLNVPFVRLLREYGVEHFYDDLKRLGVTTLNYPAMHYGLSLILGGAECSLWDLCNIYMGMSSVLNHYNLCDGLYFNNEYKRLHFWQEDSVQQRPVEQGVLDAASIWLTWKALREVERPELESGWKNFASSVDLSWKTGTSFGFRDAWAIGVNAEYVIGVWVGNADGEGRPGLVGVRAAAPVLFEVAALLPTERRFCVPRDEMLSMVVCRKSGYRASDICPERDTVWVNRAGERSELCPYHCWVMLDASEKFRVNSGCESVSRLKIKPWFILSPVQEWYYSRMHADYKKLPPYRADCQREQEEVMEMIYPQRGLQVFIPRDWGGKLQGVVFEVAHRNPEREIFWHVDDHYWGKTRYHHQMEIQVLPGKHVLYLVDDHGNTLHQFFRVVEAEKTL